MAQESWNVDASDGSGCQQQDGLVLCANNCGFFGCAATMNLCSNCFHELSSNNLEKGNLSSLSADQSSAIASVSSSVVDKSMVSALSEKSLISISQSSSFEKSVEKSVMVSLFKSHESSSAVTALLKSPSQEASVREKLDQIVGISPFSSESQMKRVLIPTQIENVDSNIPSNSSIETRSLSEENLSKSDLGLIASLFSTNEESIAFQSSSRRQTVNRCFTCRKRTGLLGFKCRCGNIFCGSHRHSVKHDCPFDYKSAAREAIAKANPVVKALKVNKI